MNKEDTQKQEYITIFTIELSTDYDFVQATQRTRQIAELLGFSTREQTNLSTAVSEIARNALRYAGGGKVEYLLRHDGVRQAFLVRVSDNGPGIPDLDEIMSGRRPGMGIIGARRLVDEFQIDSIPTEGTSVLLGKSLPLRERAITEEELNEIIVKVRKLEPQSAFEELRKQQHDLLQAMHELQQRQDELARLNQELEDTNRGVIALYAELEEKAESLRRADESKTRLLSSVSHELRTPINAIMALSGILVQHGVDKLPDEQRRQAELINKSAEALAELVDDLLDLERIESGKIEVRTGTLRVPELFSALRGMMRPLLANDRVELVIDDPLSMPVLNTDEAKVAQILRNLVSNGLKYTERGEVRVSASLDPTGRIAIFKVSDTGIGIAQEDQQRIFDEFVQLKTHMQLVRKGTGLGLSISRKLAELLGGSLTVISEPGKGSTFTLALPVEYRGSIEPAAHAVEALPQTDATRYPVLVVDDNTDDIARCEEFVKDTPFTIVPARDLKAARATLEKLRPVFILIDLLLPGESGLNLVRRIKDDPATADIPVFIASISTDSEQALELGADGFTMKPVDRQWLLDRLHEAVKNLVPEKVLVVDDDEATRYLLRQLLATTRYAVIEASDGSEALVLMEEEKPAVLILDLLMPGMSGFELLQGMRSNPDTRGTPVIVNTGKKLTPLENRTLAESDVAAIITKTLDFHGLAAEIRRALTTAISWRESREKEKSEVKS